MVDSPIMAIVLGLTFGLTWFLVNTRRPERLRSAVTAGAVFGGMGLIAALIRSQT